MDLLKFFLIIILIYLALQLAVKYVFPYVLKRYIRKTSEKIYGKPPGTASKKKEGKVSVDYVPEKDKKKKDDDLGDYVDYEEVKD